MYENGTGKAIKVTRETEPVMSDDVMKVTGIAKGLTDDQVSLMMIALGRRKNLISLKREIEKKGCLSYEDRRSLEALLDMLAKQ